MLFGTIRSRLAALGVIASAALLGHTARGQDAITTPAPPTTTNQPPVALDFQPAAILTGLRLGPFDIQPRVTTGVTYDDNILISSRKPESDLIWSMQPAFLAVAGDRLATEDYQRTYHNVVNFSPDTFIITEPENWPGKTLMVDYGPKFNWFTEHTENDSIDEFLTINALWPMGKMILGFRQEYALQDTTIIEAGRRTWEQTIPTVLMAGYQFSEKTTAEINLTRNSVSYEQQQGLADSTDWCWENWLNYQYSPRLNLSVGANLGILDLPSQPGQTYETPMVRARYCYGTRIILDGSVGEQLRQYEGGIPSTAKPVFKLTGFYQAAETTSLSLSCFRSELPSVGYSYDYIMTGMSLAMWQQFGERYFMTLSFGYYNGDYLATMQSAAATAQASRTDSYVAVTPGLEIRFTRHLIGNLFYQFRNLESKQSNGWTENQVGTRLTWSF